MRRRGAWPLAAILLATVAMAGGAALADLETTDTRTIEEKARDKVEEQALTYLSRTPAADLVYAYKAVDLAREVGEAAVEAKAHSQDALFIAAAKDAELLKALHEKGVDLRHDPVAQAIKYHLQSEAALMSAEGLSNTDFILMSVAEHPVYAVSKVAVGHAVTASFGQVMERYGGPLGKLIAEKLSHSVEGLVDQGWPLLADRAERSDAYVEAYRTAAKAELGSPAEIAAQAEKAVLDGLPAEIAKTHLEATLATEDAAAGRRALVLSPETLPALVPLPPRPPPAAAAAPIFFPVPARAAPPELWVRPVLPEPEPPLPPPMSNRDLLYRAVEREDRLQRQSPPPPPVEHTDAPPARSFWDDHPDLKEHFDCVGVRGGNCEKFMSHSGGDGGTVNYNGGFHATRNN